MSQESVQPMNPAPEEFSGPSAARLIKRLFHATRPKFYPASVLPVVTGTAWGAAVSGQMDWLVFALALLATIAVHAGSNVLNDVGDESNGSDARNDERIYPYTGGSRFIQMRILSPRAMATLGSGLLLFASLLGLLLFMMRGPMVIAFGVIGVALAVTYSLGPMRLSAVGLGESAVAAAFGVLPVTGAAWLQGAPIDLGLIGFSLPVGLWATAILLINEVPDIAADRASGKGTLPVRLGLIATSRVYSMLHVSAALATFFLSVTERLPVWAAIVPVALLFLAARSAAAIRQGIDDRTALTKAIESTLAIHTIGCLWLVACLVAQIAF